MWIRALKASGVFLAGCAGGIVFVFATAYVTRGTPLIALVLEPGMLLIEILGASPVGGLVTQLAPEGGLGAFLILLWLCTFAFWGLLFGAAAVWLYCRSLRR